MLVFLIDDDQDDQLLFELAISDLEHPIKLSTVDDGINGLEALANPDFNPDFIFIDINMPKMTGLECMVKIKEIKRLKTVPIFIYSTSIDPDLAKNCKKLGATGVLEKQTSIADTSRKLRDIFDTIAKMERSKTAK
jgi:CheY-like chemotaxis protein